MASLLITVMCLFCSVQSLLSQPLGDYSPTSGPTNAQNAWEEDQFQDDGEAEVDGWNEDWTDEMDWVLQDDIPERDILTEKEITDEHLSDSTHEDLQHQYESQQPPKTFVYIQRPEEHARPSRSIYIVDAPGSDEMNDITPDETPLISNPPAEQPRNTYTAEFPITGSTDLYCKARDFAGTAYPFQLQSENSITSGSTGNRLLRFGALPRNVVRIECVDELWNKIVFDARSCSGRRHRRGGTRSYCLMPSFIQEAHPQPAPRPANGNNGNQNGGNNGIQNGGNNDVQNGGNNDVQNGGNGVQNGGNNVNNNEDRRKKRQAALGPQPRG